MHRISSGSTKSKREHPNIIISAGCRTGSIEEVSRGLRAASDKYPDKYHTLLSRALDRAVYHGSAPIVQYLLSQENAQISTRTPLVSISPSPELFSVLVSHGWDINQCLPSGHISGRSLLSYIYHDDALVLWCLENGASVEEDPDADWYNFPPLLERVAAGGTLASFKLLHGRGARVGRRTLHRAMENAASSNNGGRMEMVKYLVDEIGLDVNQMDTEVKLPGNWGTPICYAAKGPNGGEDVARFLLERGADPYIEDCWGVHNAFSLAEFYKNEKLLEVLREWRGKHQDKMANG